MTILIAPDSFKDCLPAINVTRALCNGIKSVKKDIKVILFPMADGGEGTTEILNYHISGRWQTPEVNDPLFRKIKSRYLILNDRKTAVIELAKASGIELLDSVERNPLHTTTLGAGELIHHALDQGMDEIILAVGGSATVDGGTGVASALGFRLYDKKGQEFLPTGGALSKIHRIDASHVYDRFRQVRWTIASDVQNSLNGPEGAARVYGPQKGADALAVEQLADGLEHITELIKRDTNFNANEHPGTGAAGGAALFLMAYGNAQLHSGFDILAELTHFQTAIDAATLVISGEGRLDAQTKYGKVVSSIAHHANKKEIPLVVVCGVVSGDPVVIKRALGVELLFSIRERADSDDDSFKNVEKYLEKIGGEIAKKHISNQFKR